MELAERPLPSVYSAELSEFVFAAGLKLMQRDRPDLMYLSTTDYIQHKFAPGDPVANRFYRMIDQYLAAFDDLDVTMVITADHGMSAKHNDDGIPNVIYLQDLIDDIFGEPGTRVILPITDPYVVHHGALGSFATAYLSPHADQASLVASLAATSGIAMVLDRDQACQRFALPPDRIGDIVILADRSMTLGTSEDQHDLTGLDEPLRSHGGLSEQTVPLLCNAPVADAGHERGWRNFDAFHIGLNLARCEPGRAKSR